MRTEQIRCDFCDLEIYYSTSENPARHFLNTLSLKEFQVNNITHHIGGDFCSVGCITGKLKQLVFSEPLEKDRLQSLAKILGYTIKIEKKKVIVEKEG